MSKLMSMVRAAVPGQNQSPLAFAWSTLMSAQQDAAMSASLESISGSAVTAGQINDSIVEDVARSLNVSMESITRNGLDLTQAGREAMIVSTMMVGSLRNQKTRAASLESLNAYNPVVAVPSMHGKNAVVVQPQCVGEAAERVSVSMEAYDEQSLRNTTVYTQIYNAKHGNQDPAAAAWFPAVIVGPDEPGFAISLNIVEVQDDIRRELDGRLDDFGRKNIIWATMDENILRQDQTQLVPVYRDENKQHFVDENVIAPRIVKKDGKDLRTSVLAVGQDYNLIQLCQDDAIIRTGGMNHTDQIAGGMKLDNVYVQFSSADGSVKEVVAFPIRHLDGSNFWAPPQGNYRLTQVTFATDAIRLTGEEKLVDGSVSTLLKPIADASLAVRVRLRLNGTNDTEKGDFNILAHDPKVASIRSGNKELSQNDAAAQPVVELLANAKVIGVDIFGFLSNTQRRQRGMLLNNDFYTQIYPTVTRAPITITRSQVLQEYSESTDVAALLSATGIMTTNDAMRTIREADRILAAYVDNNDSLQNAPRVLGIARAAIKPFYERHEIKVADELMSWNSQDKSKDAQSVLVNRLRDAVFRAHLHTGYKACIEARNGGQAKKPLVLVLTDPYTANYLMLHGDLRTLGENFDLVIRSTNLISFRDQIYVSFGTEEALKGNQPDPYHFGALAWKTELVYALPTHYQGENSKQITVQPTYSHVVNLPVLIRFDVKGLADAILERTPLKTETTIVP